MFEYLMPMLVMPSYENTLLDETCQRRGAAADRLRQPARRAVGHLRVRLQRDRHRAELPVPRVRRAGPRPEARPGRGPGRRAVRVDDGADGRARGRPARTCSASRPTARAGRYGFYEAIDYTPSRLPRGQTRAVVRSFMAHHQGMSLLALAHLLLDRPMQRHFEADPRLQATLLLLQERVPRVDACSSPTSTSAPAARSAADADKTPLRVITDPDTPTPEVQLLSNGRYHVMVTNAGGGYSRWKDLAVTRWREDATRDAWGSFCYLRDVDSGAFWSTAHQPTLARRRRATRRSSPKAAPSSAAATTASTPTPRSSSRPRTTSSCGACASPTTAARRRTIEVTSYAEVVLARADRRRAASGVQQAVRADRDPRAAGRRCCARGGRARPTRRAPWMFHLMAVHGAARRARSRDLARDRPRALHRPRQRRSQSPQALGRAGALSNSAGSVLDPIAASRCVVTLAPDQAVTVDIVYGMTDSREACLALAEKYQDRRLADRVFELAWTHSAGGAAPAQRERGRCAALRPARRRGDLCAARRCAPTPSVLVRNRRGQSGLWGYAISGDLPIVLLQIGSAANIDLVRQLVQAHAWWRLKGLAVDLVIWNEERDIYRQRLQEQILGLIAGGVEAHVIDRPGGIFVRHVEQIAHEDRVLLQSVARAVLSDSRGTLAEQVSRRPLRDRRSRRSRARAARAAPRAAARRAARRRARRRSAARRARPSSAASTASAASRADGREYVIAPRAGERPPAPWVNVLANPRFGTVVSESGQRLHLVRERARAASDAVAQRPGRATAAARRSTCATRRSGQVWSPTSLPARLDGRRRAVRDPPRLRLQRLRARRERHPHRAAGLRRARCRGQVLGAAPHATNRDGRASVSATGYVEWVLGDLRCEVGAAHRHRGRTAERRALRAQPLQQRLRRLGRLLRRRRAAARGDQLHLRPHRVHRPQRLAAPARPRSARARLSGRAGAALDPCAAIQVPVDADGRRIARGRVPPRHGPQHRRGATSWSSASAAPRRRRRRSTRCTQHWRRTLGAVQVRTPDPALDVLANGWLLYQTIACRIWARSGYYQSGGAFGFRDQLQDAMALVHTRAGAAARAAAALREPPVRRGRRAALVASAAGPRRAHAHLRRLPVAAARAGALRRRDRRHRRARRGRAVPRRPAGQPAGRVVLRPAVDARHESATLVRALRCARCGTACASARTACR